MVAGSGTIVHPSDELISQVVCFRAPPKALCLGFYFSISLLAVCAGPYEYGRLKQGHWPVESIFNQFAELGRSLSCKVASLVPKTSPGLGLLIPV